MGVTHLPESPGSSTGAAPLRIVVLGAGSIGQRHARVLGELPGVMVTLAPVRRERIEALGSEGFVASSIDEALAARPDGVLVATDTGRHEADVRAALEAGAHVLCEKPLAVDGPGAWRLVDEARARARRLHVACNLRFDAGMAWLQSRVEPGTRLGDAECLSWLPGWRPTRNVLEGYAARPDEGGVLRDLIHELDLLAWLLGPVEACAARVIESEVLGLPPGVDESASLRLRHLGGARSEIRLSYAVRPTTRQLRLFGPSGLLHWDLVTRRARRLSIDGAELESFSWTGPMEMYRAQAAAWVASLGQAQTGEAALLVDGSEGARALDLCDAARRSSLEGERLVALPERLTTATPRPPSQPPLQSPSPPGAR